MTGRENRKSLNFDLITCRLLEVFGSSGTAAAYAKIKEFMLKRGFEHRQYSGYVSVDRMSYAETYDIIRDMKRELPWLQQCTQKLDITDYMAESDALEFITSEQIGIEDIDLSL